MSDAKGPSNDPSMDDILASIRKIISDDEARAQVKASAMPPAANAAPAGGAGPGALRDDVLLLTDLVEEPPEVPPAAKPTPLPPRLDPASAGETPQPAVPPPLSPVPPVASVTPVEAPVKQPSSDPLVDSGAAGVAASAFERLSNAGGIL